MYFEFYKNFWGMLQLLRMFTLHVDGVDTQRLRNFSLDTFVDTESTMGVCGYTTNCNFKGVMSKP